MIDHILKNYRFCLFIILNLLSFKITTTIERISNITLFSNEILLQFFRCRSVSVTKLILVLHLAAPLYYSIWQLFY